MTDNWKTLLREDVVANMADNANFKDGVPVIAAITRAAILAGLSNVEVQEQVKLIHPNGTPIHCIRWYRSNPGARKSSTKNVFQEALNFFFESGKEFDKEDLAQLALDNLNIIYSARGANLTNLAKYELIDTFKTAQDEKRFAAASERAQAAAEKTAQKEADKKAKAEAKEAAKIDKIEADKAVKAAVDELVQVPGQTEVDPETGIVSQPTSKKKLIKK